MTALDLSVWWIEYVIRHSGASHMKSVVQSIAWYQYYLLDVLATIILSIAVFLILSTIIARKILSFVFKTTNVKEKKS